MSRTALVALASVLALGLGLVVAADAPKPDAPKPPAPAYRLSGPYTHDNLTIFLIHGEDQLKNKNFLTLDEALEQKKIIVHETKDVNNLSVENVATDVEVFIASGDIVKGGQQDRVLAFDLVLPPKSGKVSLNVFCVEAGRWKQRGAEKAESFSSSKDQVASKDLKIANRAKMMQGEVWKEVARAQGRLTPVSGGQSQDARSPTSYQLSLENRKLLEAVDTSFKKLSGTLDNQKDVIGFAFAINGKVNSADMYASSGLFKKLWPKLLKASCIEAVAELKKDAKIPAVTAEEMKAFLADAEKGKAKEKEINKRLNQLLKETDKSYLCETIDRDEKGVRLRCNYLAK